MYKQTIKNEIGIWYLVVHNWICCVFTIYKMCGVWSVESVFYQLCFMQVFTTITIMLVHISHRENFRRSICACIRVNLILPSFCELFL